MRRSTKVLFVEGYSDKRFFLGLQRHLGREGLFDVKFPGDDMKHPGKSGAINSFSLLLSEAAEPRRYSNLALCVDADHPEDGGFKKTEEEINRRLSTNSFRLVDSQRRLFKHSSTGCVASYRITPDHVADGYIEQLMLASLKIEEQRFVEASVDRALQAAGPKRYETVNAGRARLYTYLALQRKPDKTLATMLDEGFLDIGRSPLVDLGRWLVESGEAK